MKAIKQTLRNINVENKTVIVRVDFNVPIQNGKIEDTTRIEAAIPTIRYLIDKNAKVILLSHLGRIKTLADKQSKKYSLEIVADELEDQLLHAEVFNHNNGDETKLVYANVKKVSFLPTSTGDEVVNFVKAMQPREVVLLENTRYNDVNDAGEIVNYESKNDQKLAKFWASLADVFVNDAFGTVHRAHASNVGIAKNIAVSCEGFLIEKEMQGLNKVLENSQHPFVVVMGGAKAADKIGLVRNLMKKADKVLLAGGIGINFLHVKGYKLNKRLLDPDSAEIIKQTLAEDVDHKIILPVDFVTNDTFADLPGEIKSIKEDLTTWEALDIGPKTIELFAKEIANAKSIIWNGPPGVFEYTNYEKGTQKIAEAIALATKNGAYSVIGGGDCVSAIHKFKMADQVSFVSTGGGASLTLLEGKDLPGISSLQDVVYAKYIDSTCLKADASAEEIGELCKNASKYGFAAVCVNPIYVKLAKEKLFNTDVKVCTVVGFPLGQNTTKTKVYEAKRAIKDGADEIDLVINIPELKKNCLCVYDEIRKVRKVCHNRILKVIIETCLLTDEEKKSACEFIMECKADFVKTSTGFSTKGAELSDIYLLKSFVKDKCQIKASGGIKTASTFLDMIEAGATRIGTSNAVNIISEIKKGNENSTK